MLMGKSKQLILSTHDFAEIDLLNICENAKSLKNYLKCGKYYSPIQSLAGKVMATLFFEPSTRTRMSFETAMIQLGGKVISMADRKSSSYTKGESFSDTIKTVAQYVDIIVCRTAHPISDHHGPLFDALMDLDCHFINAGDGSNNHPTQGLLDYFTIREHKFPMEPHNICVVGDLCSSRSINSLVEIIGRYPKNKIYTYNTVIDQEWKRLPNDRLPSAKIIHLISEKELVEHLPKIDILYLNRVQGERWDDGSHVGSTFSLTQKHLNIMKFDSIILNPGPRLKELPADLDHDQRIKFFLQVENGVYTRMALLDHIFSQLPRR